MKTRSLLLSLPLLLGLESLHAAEKKVPAKKSAAAVSAPLSGTSADTRMPDSYVRLAGQEIYFWAWPMMNIYNRRQMLKDIPDAGLMAGIMPVAPPNKLAMLTDYITPDQRLVASPNQDVIYGFGLMALDQSPVVVQVPNFGKRFWVYQLVDGRTDSFANMGSMYGTKPGNYLVVGPKWNGTPPKGISKVLRSSTATAVFIPQVYQDNTPEDNEAVQPILRNIMMYPVAEFNGKIKTKEWSKIPRIPSMVKSGDVEPNWVVPEKFFDELANLLDSVPPLTGEELRYSQIRALLQSADRNPHMKEVLRKAAIDAEKELITPMIQFSNFGRPVSYNWMTITNGANFGKDYFTRTATAKSNIFINKEKETKYYFQDLDVEGIRLNGKNNYTVTFAKEQLPPVNDLNGFWSLSVYNANHFFVPNDLKRYALGTKNKNLSIAPDGSLTLYLQPTTPSEEFRNNWLPTPKGAEFSLYLRAYAPTDLILSGKWTPPAVIKAPPTSKVTQTF